jgi:glutamyl-tRNA synthetase
MNGVYLRAMSPEEFADTLVTYLREQGIEWPEARVREAAPLVQVKISRLDEFPDKARFLFEDVEPDPALLDGGRAVLEAAAETLAEVQPFESERIEEALRGLADRLALKPRQALGPIRVAVTGSKVSPGLWESLELLGRDETLRRIRRAAAASA